jgi:ribosomal protein S18 acetylase RimI-like enzyme
LFLFDEGDINMCKIEIRSVTPEDNKVLAYIQTESWKAAFNKILSEEDLLEYTNVHRVEEMYARVLNNDRLNGAILTVDGEPHCMAFWGAYRGDDFPDCAELICIHSLCKNWNKGYGSIMMKHIFNELRDSQYTEMLLWVFEENIRARKFYEKHGFVLTDKCHKFCNAVEVMYSKKLKE